MGRIRAPIALVARLLLAQLFLIEGWSKVMYYAATAQYMDSHAVPGKLLPLVIMTELGGGLLIALGLLTPWVAMVMAAFSLLTAVFFHADFTDADQLINFEKNLAIAGGFLLLAVWGPGVWSVDARRTGGTRSGSPVSRGASSQAGERATG